MPPTPVLRPDTLEPVTPDFLPVLLRMDLILQEVSTERFIRIPDEAREIYTLYRPAPRLRTWRLEKALGTTARISYMNDAVSPSLCALYATGMIQAVADGQLPTFVAAVQFARGGHCLRSGIGARDPWRDR